MSGVRRLATLVAVAAVAAAPAPAHALGIAVTSTAALGTLLPGSTAMSGPVTVAVSGVLAPWSMSVAPSATATPGHLRQVAGTCTGSTTSLNAALHMDTTRGLVSTTVDRASYDLAAGSTQIAHGTLADTLTVTFSQVVGSSEAISTGCSYGLTVTYTVS